jgi:flagellar hook protein FlgE
MSLLGAMNTAISGLTAQSASFTNISENVANSQTDGYKEVDTNFSDLLTVSNATENLSGSVLTSPGYTNTVQGTVVASSDPLAMAISGQGFFPVSVAEGTASGVTSFNPQPYYTRNGDFTMNADGYLTNSAGYYLNGWSVDPTTGVANQTTLAPVQISQSEFNPVATTQLTLSANLPATPSSTAPISSQVEIYDALGTEHTVDLDWTQNSTNNWTVSINVPDNTSGASVGTANVLFGSTSGNGVPEGTVGAITGTTGSLTASSYAANTAATLGFTVNFGSGPQAIQLGMGTYGSSSGLTQYAGTTYSLEGLTQNGVPPGSFQSVTAQANGDVVVNYNNGQTRTVAQIPIVTFNAADQLQSQNGQAYTATAESGTPMAQQAGTSGAGSIVTGSVEDSNVDLATQLSQLIVAQQAYSANAKVITASNQLLQTTIDMKQ